MIFKASEHLSEKRTRVVPTPDYPHAIESQSNDVIGLGQPGRTVIGMRPLPNRLPPLPRFANNGSRPTTPGSVSGLASASAENCEVKVERGVADLKPAVDTLMGHILVRVLLSADFTRLDLSVCFRCVECPGMSGVLLLLYVHRSARRLNRLCLWMVSIHVMMPWKKCRNTLRFTFTWLHLAFPRRL